MATELITLAGHEQVVFCTDPDTGLRAIIALHDTALGPALGGTRFHPYASMDQALADVLRLSRAMTSKNAVAGLDHGGGKAVILGDPNRDKTPELLRAYGRFVESLGGRYVTACDVGTYVADMDVVGESTRWATGRSPERGGAGDSSVLTAYGVFQGMRAAAQHVWGEPTLAGVPGRHRRSRQGRAAPHRAAARRRRPGRRHRRQCRCRPATLLARHPSVRAVADVDDLLREELDVFSPNALGGALDEVTVDLLRARVVCGGANNQLVSEGHGGTAERLRERGITYAPDFLVNAGGVIQVSDELHGFDMERARRRTATIFDHTLEVLRSADAEDVTPAVAADRLAERRIAAGGPRPWLPAGEHRDT
jgi:valine dehydrogenase (NAD+)